MLSFDPASSLAILIGVNHRNREGGFDSLHPAVRHNLWDLGTMLRRKDVIGIDHVVMIEDRNHFEIAELVRNECKMSPISCLIVYFTGHGLLGDGKSALANELYLVTPNTSAEHRHDSALAFSSLRGIIEQARASYVIILVDCCFSGAAAESALSTASGVTGAFVMVACRSNKEALWPKGGRHTGFTGAMLSVLNEGLPNASSRSTISLADFSTAVKEKCRANSLPEPICQSINDSSVMQFASNVGMTGELEDKDRQILEEAGIWPGTQQAIRDGQVEEGMRQLDDLVYKRICQNAKPADRDPMIKAICKIETFRKLHEDDYLNHDIQQHTTEIKIAPNGDARISVEVTLIAARPIRSLWRYANGDAPLQGFPLLRLGFESSSVTKATFIPLVDELKQKQFIIYLDPPIPAGQPLTYKLHWSWPRAFESLFRLPCQDTWAFRVKSAAANVVMSTTRFIIPTNCGRLEIDKLGPGEMLLVKCGLPVPEDYSLFEWETPGLPALNRVAIKLSLPELAARIPQNGGVANEMKKNANN